GEDLGPGVVTDRRLSVECAGDRRHRQSRCFGDVLDAHHARVHLLRPSSVFVWAGPKSHGPYIVETITRWETITSCMGNTRSEEHTSELQSRFDLVCRLLLEKKN